MSDQPPEQALLDRTETVAVVGLSTDPKRDSHIVANHLKRSGYRIVPIHPSADAILGEPAYASFAELPEDLAAEIDVVNIFRPSEEVPDISNEAVAHLPNLLGIWTQKNIRSDEGAAIARDHGVQSVQDRCIRTQDLYRKFAATKREQQQEQEA